MQDSAKYLLLKEALARSQRIAVAFSGGVDSSLLLQAACAALGPERVTALHARTGFLPCGETERAARTATALGCRFLPVDLDPLSWPDFTGNGPERCYLCKKRIYQIFLTLAGEGALLDGTNADDLAFVRPGRRALAELAVPSPLAAVSLGKAEIRALARYFSLPAWNAPSSSCLATRIESGEEISREKIILVARCEAIIQAHGFTGVRVRFSRGRATIVVLQGDLLRIMEKPTVEKIETEFFALGIREVAVDREGRLG